ncbi:MAG TPA: hypothetical protein VHC04_13030 [Rhodopila sp.]|jgi:hypothetical protein|nr:hypothetical protein [Rhodopila sp.]
MDIRHAATADGFQKKDCQVHLSFPHMIRDLFNVTSHEDEHLLAGADEASVQALGVSQPVLSRFQSDVAVLCPGLVQEAQLGMSGK